MHWTNLLVLRLKPFPSAHSETCFRALFIVETLRVSLQVDRRCCHRWPICVGGGIISKWAEIYLIKALNKLVR